VGVLQPQWHSHPLLKMPYPIYAISYSAKDAELLLITQERILMSSQPRDLWPSQQALCPHFNLGNGTLSPIFSLLLPLSLSPWFLLLLLLLLFHLQPHNTTNPRQWFFFQYWELNLGPHT
jgi:hypothetical protein